MKPYHAGEVRNGDTPEDSESDNEESVIESKSELPVANPTPPAGDPNLGT